MLPLAALWLQGDIGLSFYDEGFTWYGAQRVLAGEVPLRDFQSYDVGRYYWSAAWMHLAGDNGILQLRIGNAVLGGLTLAVLAALVGSVPGRRTGVTVLAMATCWLWMAPDYRAADCFAAVLLIAGLSRLLEKPSVARHWGEFGVCYGIAAAIGINHALYGCIGLVMAIAFLRGVDRSSPTRRCLLALGAGAGIGYGPVLALHVAVPGFSAAFVDSILVLFELGTTNLKLPLPRRGLALLFALAPPFWLLCAWRLGRVSREQPVRSRPTAVFAAAVLLSVPYAHYALSRADINHAALSTLPLLLAAWTYPAAGAFRRRALAGFLTLISALMLPRQPAWDLVKGEPLERVAVGSATLRLDASEAMDVRLLQKLAERHAPDGRLFYAAPYWPGAYAVLDRRSPTWEIFPLFPARPDRQRRELARLKEADIGFAILSDWKVDHRAELGFARTHPLLHDHVRGCLDPVAKPITDPSVDHLTVYVPTQRSCDSP